MKCIPDVSCAIQVGGEGRRLGRDKALLMVGGQTLTERIVTTLTSVSDDVMVVGTRLHRFVPIAARLVEDEVAGRGALGGIYSSLLHARHCHLFVSACDLPFLNLRLVRYLCSLAPGFDVVMPVLRGRLEPLHAVYGTQVLPEVGRLVQKKDARIVGFLPEVRVRTVHEAELRAIDPDLRSFFNLNTAHDLTEMWVLLSAVERLPA